jgi:hypothetical protein
MPSMGLQPRDSRSSPTSCVLRFGVPATRPPVLCPIANLFLSTLDQSYRFSVRLKSTAHFGEISHRNFPTRDGRGYIARIILEAPRKSCLTRRAELVKRPCFVTASLMRAIPSNVLGPVLSPP